MSNRFTYQWTVVSCQASRRRRSRKRGSCLGNCKGSFCFFENMSRFPYWLHCQTLRSLPATLLLPVPLPLLRPFCASFSAGYGKYLNAISGTVTPFLFYFREAFLSGPFPFAFYAQIYACVLVLIVAHVKLELFYWFSFICRCIQIAFSRLFFMIVLLYS